MSTTLYSLASAMGILFSMGSPASLGAQHHGCGKGGHEHQQGTHEHQEQGTLQVGKKGQVSFAVETKVGDLSLRPGLYRFQHRVENGGHYVRFTELGQRGIKEVVGEVECAIEPAGEEFSRTTVFSLDEAGTKRVTRIEVKGENAAHVF